MRRRTKVFIAMYVPVSLVVLMFGAPMVFAYLIMLSAGVLPVWGLVGLWKRFTPASWKRRIRHLTTKEGEATFVWLVAGMLFVVIALLSGLINALYLFAGLFVIAGSFYVALKLPLEFKKASNPTKTRASRRLIPGHIKDTVWRRDGGACVQCGSTRNLLFDRIIPYSLGGDYSVENLQVLCKSCNRSKGTRI